jgi:hypothetical protein
MYVVSRNPVILRTVEFSSDERHKGNRLYTSVTVVYYYNYHDSGHYPSPSYLKRRKDNVRTSQETHYVSATSRTG